MRPRGPRRSSRSRQDRGGELDPGRKPRRDQDLQQVDARRSSPQSAPGFDFQELIKASGARAPTRFSSLSRAPSQSIAALVGKAPLGVLKDQLLVRSLDAYAPYLPKAFDDENFAFYGTMLSGTPRARGALEAGGELHRRHARRRRQQALRRALSSRRRPRPPPTSWSTTSSRRWTAGSTSSSG